MTAPEWRDCADPDELAAAVAAGVEVQVTDQYGNTGPTCRRTASAFLDAIRDGFTYQLPTAWTWSPEPPVPPWPGAVLSGLTDEDGVPTWLAQAGQVRGEQVRACTSVPWLPNTSYGEDEWVEVRAPRAVPVPETERVPWWEAVGREVFDQDGTRVTIEHVQCGDGGGPSVTAYNTTKRRDNSLYRVPCPVRGDGTVEVLKDGDQ